MGNYNFRPQKAFGNNQSVQIIGFKFSQDQVPKQIGALGKNGHALKTIKLYKSRSGAPDIYVTIVKVGDQYETFLTNDLRSI